MPEAKKQTTRILRRPEEIARLDPDLNPYSAKLLAHKDRIWYGSPAESAGFAEFVHAPLVVDLGCGSGMFLQQFAALHPEMHCLGFELRFKRLVRAAEKYNHRGLTNIRLVRALAEEVGNWLEPASVNLLHVNFPDPWAKPRQRKHRLIQPGFVDQVHRLLKPQGRFVFKTDHQEYYLSSLEFLCQDSRFQVRAQTQDLHTTSIFNLETEFERLFKGKNTKVCYVELEKN